MVIFRACKQMDFIYYWKIKPFKKNWWLHDLLKQKVATGDLQNIVVITHSTYILCSLLPLAGPNNELIVAFCKRHKCCVQVSPVNVYCPSAHIMLPLNWFSMVDLQMRGWVYILWCHSADVTRYLSLWKFTESNLISLMWSGASHAGSPYAN